MERHMLCCVKVAPVFISCEAGPKELAMTNVKLRQRTWLALDRQHISCTQAISVESDRQPIAMGVNEPMLNGGNL